MVWQADAASQPCAWRTPRMFSLLLLVDWYLQVNTGNIFPRGSQYCFQLSWLLKQMVLCP